MSEEMVRLKTGEATPDLVPMPPLTPRLNRSTMNDSTGIALQPHASERQLRAMPLAQFPQAMRDQIASQVLLPIPPERWISFGGNGSPLPLASIESRAWWEWHWQRGMNPDAKREQIPAAMRQSVIERDGLLCGICAGAVERSDVHIDHIYPYSRGGRSVMRNLRVTHSRCNMSKGARV